MREEEFKEVVSRRFYECQDLMLNVKGPEYTTQSNPDQLSNFKRAGDIQNCAAESALVGMWMKHIVSILNIVDEWKEGGILPSQTKFEEKIMDAINYLVLLEALFAEHYPLEGQSPGTMVEVSPEEFKKLCYEVKLN